MPMTSSVDEPLDYVTISGPAADDLERRREANSDPKIAARDLRRNLDHVRDALFADIRSLVESTARRLGTDARKQGTSG